MLLLHESFCIPLATTGKLVNCKGMDKKMKRQAFLANLTKNACL
jgi:hypothetical protein